MDSEATLFLALKDRLKALDVDERRIVRDYAIGNRFRADCIVLSPDGRTPSLCFELKAKGDGTMLGECYSQLSQVANRLVGIDICYLVYSKNGRVMLMNSCRREIPLDANLGDVRAFLRREENEAAICDAFRTNSLAIASLKSVMPKIVVPTAVVCILLDVSKLFPMTPERLIFVAMMLCLAIAPYLIDVFVAHPDLLAMIVKLLERGKGK